MKPPAIAQLHIFVETVVFATPSTPGRNDFTRALPLGNDAGNPIAEFAERHLLEPDDFKIRVHIADRPVPPSFIVA